jgi:hypothetical protein
LDTKHERKGKPIPQRDQEAHVWKLSRVVIIQDYEDQKKQYHNLEKDYVVHGKPRSIRIPMVNTTEDKSPTRRRMQSTFIRS